MRNIVPLCVARVARIGALLTVAVLAAVMMAGPAGAHHRPGHDGGPPETATFAVTASGDVFFLGIAEGEDPPGAKSSQVHLHDPNTPTWDLSFFVDEFGTDGAKCFGDPPSTPDPDDMMIGRRDTDGVAWVAYRFDALDKDGATVGYVLLMTGTFAGDFAPAEVGDTSIITLTEWKLSVEGKGTGQRNSCTGEGDFGTVVTVVVTRTN